MRPYRVVASAILSLSCVGAAQSKSIKPEAIGGKFYSKPECVKIARWVTGDINGLKALTGVEVGNFWYTLDSCGYLHFSDLKSLNRRPSDDQLEMDVAIDWAAHEYIDRLEAAIARLAPTERDKIADDLKQPARPIEGKPLWAIDK
jgi:hypothetical protein